MMQPVAELDELEDGRTAMIDAGDRQALLVRIGDAVYATEPRCPHARSILGPGPLSEDCLIECPMHGALFSPVDGMAHKGPTRSGLETYPAEVRDGTVHVDFDAARPRPDLPPELAPKPSPWDAWTAPEPITKEQR